MFPVIDLHCDLLSYLSSGAGRTPFDPIARCAYPQLKAGGVALQTLAIFTETAPGSIAEGMKQVAAYERLLSEHASCFAPLRTSLPKTPSEKIGVIPAFENASSFAEENEPLQKCLSRLESLLLRLSPLLYIGLTWNTENRFAGGILSDIGLKEDGKHLLEWMHGHCIACDFSHLSDRAAYDIIEHIDRCGLEIPIIASHSNFRVVHTHPRNLPDPIAKEIIRRQGLIGLNFFGGFSHTLLAHATHALSLGAEHTLCFGADFFCDADFPDLKEKYQMEHCFFPEYSNASTYPHFLKGAGEQLPAHILEQLSWKNALNFLQRSVLRHYVRADVCDANSSPS